MTYEWRTTVSHHWARDEVLIYLGLRNGDRFEVAGPCPIVMTSYGLGEAIVNTESEEPFLRLPTEALPALFDCLARELFGEEAAQLRHKLEISERACRTAETRLDRLIDGLASVRATGPGGTPPDHLTRSGKVERHDPPSDSQP